MARKTVPVLLIILTAALSAYQVELLDDSHSSTRFAVQFGTPYARHISGDYWLIKMDGFGHSGEDYGPQLFGRNFQVAVPRDCEIEVKIDDIEWSEWTKITPAPKCPKINVEGAMGEFDPFLYAMPQGATVELNGRRIVRGVQIADIFVEPVQYDPGNGVRFMRNITISLDYTGGGMTDCGRRLYHPTWENYYRAILVNPSAAVPRNRPTFIEWDPADGADILAIVRPDFEDELQDWVDWKLLMGFPIKVVTTSVTGTDTTSIKAYIQDAYDTWAMPPAFLLLCADADYIPSIQGSGGMSGDNNYATVDGSDIHPDIFPGRISVDYTDHIELLVVKHLNYEKHPDTTDDWYARYVGIVNEDDPDWDPLGPQDSSYLAAITYGRDQCQLAGFTSYPMFRRHDGDDFYDVEPYVRAGLGLVQYRGQAWPDYYYGFNGGLDTLDNDGKCPINISISCGTGAFMSGDTRMCERSTRAGTVSDPKGATGFMGQSLVSSNSEERSSLSKHVFEGLFEADLHELAAAHTYGKNEMYSEFGGSWDSRYEFLSAVVLGSPEMLVWTGPIDLDPTITYPTAVYAGPNNVDVNVKRFSSNLEDARVALHQGSAFSYGKTDASGDVTVSIDIDPANALVIVVSGPNIYPLIDTIDVIEEGLAVYAAPVTYNDYIGNEDRLLNPGETVSFNPGIFNIGTEVGTGLSASLNCEIPVVWIDSLTDFPTCAPDDTVYGDEVVFQIPDTQSALPNIVITLHITGDPSGPWDRDIAPEPAIHRFSPLFETIMVFDSPPYGDDDGVLEAGEVADLYIRLSNNTLTDAYNIIAHLIDIPNVAVINEYAFLDIWNRGDTEGLTPLFTVSASPGIDPGTEVSFPMEITAHCSIYNYLDTINIPLTLGGSVSNMPTGPDSYGYYIYEDVDTDYPMAPSYEWFDISGIGIEITPVSDADDEVYTIGLPFDMTFYGVDFDSITVASNGYINPGTETWHGAGTGSPQEYPTVGGPDGIISPAWADLAPHRADGGEIYAYNDTGNDQFIIQWDECEFYYGGGEISTQLRICDPSSWSTPTGDSEFFIYYEFMSGIGAMGIGIESQDESMGLQYYLNGAYDEHAVELDDGRALRITTLIPPDYSGPWLYYIRDLWIDDSLNDNDGLIEPGDRIGIRMRIENGGTASAPNTEGETGTTTMISPYGSRAPFGNIGVGANSYNTVAMHCDISGSCPVDTILEVPINLFATGYTTTFYIQMHVGGAVSVTEDEIELPRGIELGNCYPNPFNCTASIEIAVGYYISDEIAIDIYDITGRKIDNLHYGSLKPGRYTFRFEPTDIASGVYFVRLRCGNETQSRKIVLIE